MADVSCLSFTTIPTGTSAQPLAIAASCQSFARAKSCRGFSPLARRCRLQSKGPARRAHVAASHSTPGGSGSSASGGSGGGSLVDANLWKLQKRIEMVRMEELSTCAPTEWEEWEKHFYAGWCLQVSHLLLKVQSHLLAVRPSFVLPAVSLAMVVTPTLVLFYAASGFDQVFDAVKTACMVDVSLPIVDTTVG